MFKMFKSWIKNLIRPIVIEVLRDIETQKEVSALQDIIKLNNLTAEQALKDHKKVQNYLDDRKIKTLNKTIVDLNTWQAEQRKQKNERLSKTKAKPIHRETEEERKARYAKYDKLNGASAERISFKRTNDRRPQTNAEAGLKQYLDKDKK